MDEWSSPGTKSSHGTVGFHKTDSLTLPITISEGILNLW